MKTQENNKLVHCSNQHTATTPMTPKQLGIHIIGLLAQANMSQSELSKRTGYNYYTLNAYLNGRAKAGTKFYNTVYRELKKEIPDMEPFQMTIPFELENKKK